MTAAKGSRAHVVKLRLTPGYTLPRAECSCGWMSRRMAKASAVKAGEAHKAGAR